MHVLFALALAATAPGSDHLVAPLEPSWAYEFAVNRWLLPEPSVDTAMVCRSSFDPETAVYVVRPDPNSPSERGLAVVVNRARKSIWLDFGVEFARRGNTPEIRKQVMLDEFAALARLRVTIDTTTAPIDEETVVILEALWERALIDVAPPDLHPSRFGVDGETCQFLDWFTGVGHVTGDTWSPRPGSRMAGLIGVGRQLIAYAEATPDRRAKARAALRESARAATALFDPPGSVKDRRRH